MSLKGYQWLDDNGKAVMGFFFKDLSIFLWEDVTKEEYDKFYEYIREQGFEPHSTDQNNHTIIGLGE